jgi:hypothetical protein
LKERIWQRIQGWKEKLLSSAGKEVLIKAVGQAIPTFSMGCFDITKEICDQISTMIDMYWWSNQDEENKMHWISWEKMTEPKGKGGLDFRDIHIFNLAMLAKQGWRLIQSPDSLCARVLRAKYFPNGNIWEARNTIGISYTWRSILKGLRVLEKGVIWRVGNGRKIKIWSDPWLPRSWTRRPITPRRSNLLDTVDELIDPTTAQWDSRLVNETFFEQDAKLILSLPVHPDMEDVLAWHDDSKGVFTVRSTYKMQRELANCSRGSSAQSATSGVGWEESFWKGLWKIKCPGKIRIFLWRMAHNSITVRMGLERRGMELDTKCVMCGRLNEDGGHLLFQCKFVKRIWQQLNLEELRRDLANKRSPQELLYHILGLKENIQLRVINLLWHWWLERNRVWKGEQRRSPVGLAAIIVRLADEFPRIGRMENVPVSRCHKKWSRPAIDEYKINTDGAFLATRGGGGWGYVIRNHDGQVVKAGAGKSTHLLDAFHSEVLACKAGVQATEEYWGCLAL